MAAETLILEPRREVRAEERAHPDGALRRTRPKPTVNTTSEGTSPAHAALVITVLGFAAFLRVAALDRYPLPIHQDELSDIYDGYCLATTGADRSGTSWPVLIRGMGPGDYHPGMYAYLAAATTYFSGFSVAAGRLPAAVAGILTVFLVYLTALRLVGRTGAVVALVFGAFSPILIQYSRQAHQGVCLVPLLVILIVYAFVGALGQSNGHIETRGDEDTVECDRRPAPLHRYIARWVIAGLMVGISTNAYAGQRLTALLFALFGCAFVAGDARHRRMGFRLAAVVVVLFGGGVVFGALPQIYAAIAHPEQFFARGNTTFYSFDHGAGWWIERLTRNLWANIEPHYLFFSFGEYSLLSVQRLNWVWVPFLYLGVLLSLIRSVRQRSPCWALVPVGIACSLLPAMATEGNPSPMRSSGVWALYPIVAAAGVIWTGRAFIAFGQTLTGQWTTPTNRDPRSFSGIERANLIAVVLLIVVAGLFDVARYLKRPDLHGPAAQHHFVRIGEWIGERGAPYDRVYIAADGLFGYLYIAAFSGMSPPEYRAAEREGTVSGYGWDVVHRLGRYYFSDLDQAIDTWDKSKVKERWLVIEADGRAIELAPTGRRIVQRAWGESPDDAPS